MRVLTCPALRELDLWFALALDVLADEPALRRDVLLVVGGAASVAEAASVTWDCCFDVSGYLVVYPRGGPMRSLPLTPAFLEVTGLSTRSWPERRDAGEPDEAAVRAAVDRVGAAYASATRKPYRADPDRLRALRMHAWEHELGRHVGVLDLFRLDRPGPAEPGCPLRRDSDAPPTKASVPTPRSAARVAATA